MERPRMRNIPNINTNHIQSVLLRLESFTDRKGLQPNVLGGLLDKL